MSSGLSRHLSAKSVRRIRCLLRSMIPLPTVCVTMAVRMIISHSRQVILLLTFISCPRNVIILDATTAACESPIIQETQTRRRQPTIANTTTEWLHPLPRPLRTAPFQAEERRPAGLRLGFPPSTQRRTRYTRPTISHARNRHQRQRR